MSVKERLIGFIKYKGITKSAFCASIGVSNAFISSMRTSIQPDKVQSISLKYPELNMGWIMTGEGEMLRNSYPDLEKIAGNTNKLIEDSNPKYGRKLNDDIIIIPREVFEMINKLTDTVQSQQRTIESMQNQFKET